jgi:hypothetical protein
MSEGADLGAAMAPVDRCLRELAVAYRVTGSVASAFRGTPRSTLDIDLVAALRPAHAVRLADRLAAEYYLDGDAAEAAVRAGRMFNLVHLATAIKVDIYPQRAGDYDRGAMLRATEEVVELAGGVLRLPVSSAEDLILAKLQWFDSGGRVSERQWTDVIGILRVQGSGLDDGYLDRWAPTLGVAELLASARVRAGDGSDR